MNSKKILLFDDSEKSKERLILLLDNTTDFKCDMPNKEESAESLFESNSYEFVIIEHSSKGASSFMDFALDLKPKQKMILLSDSLNCPIDCDTCLTKFNFVRLLKPITVKSILRYLVNIEDNDFNCLNKHRFDNVDSLEKLYEFIYLEENYFFTHKELVDNSLYIKTKLKSTLRFDELIKIENYVNKEYFDFNLIEDNTILITKI
jgi:hypothetical protein